MQTMNTIQRPLIPFPLPIEAVLSATLISTSVDPGAMEINQSEEEKKSVAVSYVEL
jgi:hypothetical protein